MRPRQHTDPGRPAAVGAALHRLTAQQAHACPTRVVPRAAPMRRLGYAGITMSPRPRPAIASAAGLRAPGWRADGIVA
ncbi:MAG: hypothetical protein RLZZ584_1635 [Pseudomonadota bacterium]